MKGGYTIPGYFQDCKIEKDEVKEKGFFGKVLYVIKKNELREPGIFGKTVLVFKKDGIYEPGFLGKRLFNVTKYGEVKENKLFGKTVGAMPVEYFGGVSTTVVEEEPEPIVHSAPISYNDNDYMPKQEPKKTLEEFKEELDVKSGFNADCTNIKNTDCVVVPEKYSTITSIAPALAIKKLVIHANILHINGMGMLSTIKEEFDVASDNPKFTSIEGVLYDKDVTRLLKVPANYDFSKLNIPSSVETIGGKAFWGCSIESFDVPSNIKSIGKEAFGLCKKMQHIYIPLSVINMGDSPFWECKKLYIETAYESIPQGWGKNIQPGAKPIKWNIIK